MDLVKFVILLHRLADSYVTSRDVHRTVLYFVPTRPEPAGHAPAEFDWRGSQRVSVVVRVPARASVLLQCRIRILADPRRTLPPQSPDSVSIANPRADHNRRFGSGRFVRNSPNHVREP